MLKNNFSFFQNQLQKKIWIFCFALIISFLPLNIHRANAWDAMAAAAYQDVKEELKYNIRGLTMGALKQAAIQTITKQMNRFISGVGNNNARFITNWNDYLVYAPQRKAIAYTNDYISRAFSGRGSSSSYWNASGSVLGASMVSGEGFGKVLAAVTDCTGSTSGTECQMSDGSTGTCQSSGGGNLTCVADATSVSSQSYAQKMTDMLQNEVIAPDSWKMTYTEDPKNMFEHDDLSYFNLYILGKNTPADIKLNTAATLSQAYQNEKNQATAMAIANQGYKSAGEESGAISMPGGLIKDMQANVENLANLAMVNATSIAELASATVSKAITSLAENAVNGVSNAIDQKLNSITDKAVQQVNKNVNAYGPGALYKKNN